MNELDILGTATSVQDRLRAIHDVTKEYFPLVSRVAVASYDAGTGMLKTFVHSTDGEPPFSHYDARLEDVPSLVALVREKRDRVIDDLSAGPTGDGPHTRTLVESGYRSSYTKPFFNKGEFFGFMFFDSRHPGYFTPTMIHHLSICTALISEMITKEMERAEKLRSAVQVVKQCGHMRDAETGGHLERMAHYAELIARTIAARDPDDAIDDEFVEFVYLFAPLHDIGKISIPDHILLKEGRLTQSEFETMQSHVVQGVRLIDTMTESFGVAGGDHAGILRNIVRYHHEAFDGSGYPGHLAGEAIPLEARIVTVADVFDALTSTRTYKPAWPNDDAFSFLSKNAGSKFDPTCVAALAANRPRIEQIQARFASNGSPGFHEAYTPDL